MRPALGRRILAVIARAAAANAFALDEHADETTATGPLSMKRSATYAAGENRFMASR